MIACNKCKHYWVQGEGSHWAKDVCLARTERGDFDPVTGGFYSPSYFGLGWNRNGDCPKFEKEPQPAKRKKFFWTVLSGILSKNQKKDFGVLRSEKLVIKMMKKKTEEFDRKMRRQGFIYGYFPYSYEKPMILYKYSDYLKIAYSCLRLTFNSLKCFIWLENDKEIPTICVSIGAVGLGLACFKQRMMLK